MTSRSKSKSKIRSPKGRTSGRLRIGDDWNAITIIALSQTNPLKAVAEFVENSIDAGARNVTITRGKERGQPYLTVVDDGTGILKDDQGIPNFRYVATHICDSIKRRLKDDGVEGIQGEFGIGLLSFWTVGEELTLTSAGDDEKTYQMHMRKGDPSYTVSTRRVLFSPRGVELKIKPLLPGIRQFSGEKIQWYLASELRDRIRHSHVQITVIDRHARKQYSVRPREFSGRLIRQLPTPSTSIGDVYLELYLGSESEDRRIGLYRSGTRVLENLSDLVEFDREPWSGTSLEGIVDAPFLNLTPGTRTGIVHDHAFLEFSEAMEPVALVLTRIVEDQLKAEEERVSRQVLKTIQRAFREALLSLPPEEYDWFDLEAKGGKGRQHSADRAQTMAASMVAPPEEQDAATQGRQKAFFDYPGPLFALRISPSSCVLPVGQTRTLRAIPRDRSGRVVEHDLRFTWTVSDGEGSLDNPHSELVQFTAGSEPGLTRLSATVTQGSKTVEAESLITVTDSLLPEVKESFGQAQGLPGYTFRRASGELWRSRYDAEGNLIVINSGHRDFVFASRTRALKLRYIARLFAKELVCKNFPGYSANELLERMIELSLYTEENLK